MIIVAATLSTMLLAAVGTMQPPAPPQPASPTAPAARSERTPLDHALTLPVLPVVDGVTALPLGGEEPFPWRPIRDGITHRGGEQLAVSYTRTRGKPAGAVLLVKPGTFAELDALQLSISGNRTQTLSVSLTQADGTVWTVGPISVRTGKPREIELRAADIELDPHQNRGRTGTTFDAASVYSVTVLDIAGYMSATEPECEWTITSFKAVRR